MRTYCDGNPLKSWVIKKCLSVDYPRFNWILSWDITNVCNLNCEYCFIKTASNHPPVLENLEKILRFKPKVLLVTGGEPLTVPFLDEVLSRIRDKLPGIYIALNTNLLEYTPLLDRCLPYLNKVGTSIDGLGDLNKKTRHVSGEVVLNNLQKLIERVTGLKNDLHLGTNTVLTEQNILHTGELACRLSEISRDLTIHFTPMLPSSRTGSPLRKPALMAEFFTRLASLRARLGNFITVSGPGMRRMMIEQEEAGYNERRLIHHGQNCYAQFFVQGMDVSGAFHSCKPLRYLEYYRSRYRENGGALSSIIRAPGIFYGICSHLTLRPANPHCPFPCGCYEMIDDLIMTENREDLQHLLKRMKIALNLTADEKNVSSRFIRRHFNPHFQW